VPNAQDVGNKTAKMKRHFVVDVQRSSTDA